MYVTELGNSILIRDEQPAKAPLPIYLQPAEILMFTNEEQPLNALIRILSTLGK